MFFNTYCPSEPNIILKIVVSLSLCRGIFQYNNHITNWNHIMHHHSCFNGQHSKDDKIKANNFREEVTLGKDLFHLMFIRQK